eukprot:scaffold25502_cov129-Isochrysis_galbana.AAC.2
MSEHSKRAEGPPGIHCSRESPGKDALDVFAEKGLVNAISAGGRQDVRHSELLSTGMEAPVRGHDKICEALVLDRVDCVLNHADAVEAREDRIGQIDILGE